MLVESLSRKKIIDIYMHKHKMTYMKVLNDYSSLKNKIIFKNSNMGSSGFKAIDKSSLFQLLPRKI